MTTKKAQKIVMLTELLAKELDVSFHDLFEKITDDMFEEDVIKLSRVNTDNVKLEVDDNNVVTIRLGLKF